MHGAGFGAWSWHLVEAALRERGHEVVAIDLPADDEAAGLWDYADAVTEAIGDRTDLVVVGHSFGGFTAPLVAERVPVDALVLIAGMVPAPGEAPSDWWANSGQTRAQRSAGGETDEVATYYHDVPADLVAEAERRTRNHPSERAYVSPWPLDAWPAVPTHYLLLRDDRLLPAGWVREMVRARLGITADEMGGGHSAMLSRPVELAERLEAYAPASG